MPIHFKASISAVGSWTILILPKNVSSKLPSRGLVMIKGILNNTDFKAVLEPDGQGSHWLEIDKTLREQAKINPGDTVTVAMEAIKEWIEPAVPADLKEALKKYPQANDVWEIITPMARWDWIRWIRSTKQAETRQRRIEVACSKLKAGSRRPCCFNRNMCTEPAISNNGVLIEKIKIKKI